MAGIDKTSSSQTMAIDDIKVSRLCVRHEPVALTGLPIGVGSDSLQAQYEARYTSQQDMFRSEIASLSDQADLRSAEVRRFQSTVASYKLSNEELNVSRVLRQLDEGH